MKRCKLCKSMARVYCDSDRASLCWSCDAKVHSANFLVARHSRSLLCQVCLSPTPWSASGEKLGPATASICGRCVVEGISDDDDDIEERVVGNDGEIGTGGDEIELEDSVGDNDNQVVPWSSTPPPPAPSSSSSEEFPTGVLLKRKRQNVADLTSEEDHDSSSVSLNRNMTSSPMPEPAISGDETASFHSVASRSESAAGKLKRIRIITMSAPIPGTIKSTTNSELDFNWRS